MSFIGWLRARKAVSSATVLAILIATPVTLAVLHNGFPVSDVNLQAKDVWVTNNAKALVGRLNTQITELDGGLSAAAKNFDVLQNGANLFVSNAEQGSLSRIDPSFATLKQKIDAPGNSEVTFGGGRLAIVRPSDGALWLLDATSALQFDPKAQPVMKLGKGGAAAVGLDGSVAAASTAKQALFEIPAGSTTAIRKASLSSAEPSVTLVGSHAVALIGGTIVFDDGSRVTPSPRVLRLQQPGPDRDTVLVATGSSLLQVSSGGKQVAYSARVSTPSNSTADVAAPVVLDNCLHGAWSTAHRYLGACAGQNPVIKDIPVGKSDARLLFRVNRDVIALNNVTDGSVWIVKNAEFVDANLDWNQATPPSQDNSQQNEQNSSVPNFEQAVTDRSPTNHPPVARPDSLGARPGKTTILDVLANDTDPDGDVLTITAINGFSDSAGKLELIQGGRALQFVPADGLSGTVSFRYTVSDGRGGTAETNVDVAVRPVGSGDLPPVSRGTSAVTLEQGKTISYNVLGDWYDPNGDDLILVGASAPNALVRFSPDGLITYTQLGSELGPSTVTVQVSNGSKTANGTFIVDIKEAGKATPIGTPDYATAFVGQTIDVAPLANDLSPSGAPLTLVKVTAFDQGLSLTTNLDQGTVSVLGSKPGTYYLDYVIAAGTETSHGLIRVDVLKRPDSDPGPTAVRDVAYLRPNQPVTLPVLDNDVSPSGSVLGIQSVTIPAAASKLSIQVLSSTVIKITAPSGMTVPVEFQYTISDGTKTSTAGVAVVPLPELPHHQAPIAIDDTAKARVGDIASVDVLANDFHPDGAQMHLDPTLVSADVGDGLAFVTGNQVRLQAPSKPGQYAVTYRIYDDFGEASTAKVTFTVLARDVKTNAPPHPQIITARVFQGATLKVQVPLNGIDPEGDSVTLFGVGAGTLGQVADVTPTSFSYQAYADKTGTDSFSYEVHDAFGASATGQIRIGVIPRPTTVLAPNAVDDQVAIRPGRISSVPVLANDSDPNGYPIQLERKLLEVQSGLGAVVSNDVVVVTAPKKVGSYSVHYQINNGHGGSDAAFLIVKVATDAPLNPPVAFDQSVDGAKIIGKHTIIVDVLHDAQNSGGLVSDLKASVIGPNKSNAKVNDDGTVTVTLGATRQALAYRLTNVIDNLSATAFIVVPAFSDSVPPKLKSDFKVPQNTAMNTPITWKLSEILDVPSGRPVMLAAPSTATAGRQAAGVPLVTGNAQLTFTPEKDFRGNTVISFKVTDTENTDDPNATTIQIPVVVGDPSFRDVAPTFANQTVEIQPGEPTTTLDLRKASSHPNPAVINELQYNNVGIPTSAVKASISGAVLSASTDVSTPVGTTMVVKFTVVLGANFSVPGQVTIKVVKSTRPLPQTVDDAEPNGRSDTTYTISPLANDFNPFADKGTPLKVVGVTFQGDALGATQLSHTDSTVSVHTGTAKSGTINLIYTVRDAANSADREVQGRIVVTVTSAPEPVTSFALSSSGSQTVAVVFQPPISSNGSPITGYTVRMAAADGTATRTDCSAGSNCTFTGRTNGQTQTVDISATNNVGTTWSSTRAIIPYGTPSAPTNPVLSSNSSTATATITPQWSGPADSGGGSLTYGWNFTQGSSASGTTAGTSGYGQSVGQGDYTFQVRACNTGGLCSGYVSASVHINNPPPPPPPPAAITFSKGSTTGVIKNCSSGNCYYYHIVATNFPANTAFAARCYSNDGTSAGNVLITTTAHSSSGVALAFDGNGAFSGDLSCFDGYSNTNSVQINTTTSNSVKF